MRPITLWLSLLAFCIVANLMRTPSSVCTAHGRGPQANARTVSTEPVFVREVDGFGETDDDARARALENACDRVADFLAVEYGETTFKPSPRDLQRLNIVPITKEVEVSVIVLENLGPTQKATLLVNLLPEDVKKLREQARQQRVQERQHGLGIILSGVIALLLVAVGYLRLEEATKGYYTGLLRLSALGTLLLTGLFIWRFV